MRTLSTAALFGCLFAMAPGAPPVAAQSTAEAAKPFVITSTRLDDQHLSDGFCFDAARCFLVFRSGRYPYGAVMLRRFNGQGRPFGRDIIVEKEFEHEGGYGDRLPVRPIGKNKLGILRVESRDYYETGFRFSLYTIDSRNKVKEAGHSFIDLANNHVFGDSGDFALLGKGYLAVLEDDLLPDLDVLGQRYSGAGKPVGKPFRINQSTAGVPENPAIRRLTSGGYAVVWRSGGSIRVRALNRNGKPVGPENGIAFSLSTRISRPMLEPLPGGRFAVFFFSSNDTGGLQYAMFNSSGKLLKQASIEEDAFGSNVSHNAFSVVRKLDGGFAFVYRRSLGYPKVNMYYKEYDAKLRVSRRETLLLEQTSNDIDEFDAISIVQSARKRGLVSWTTDPSGMADGNGRALLGLVVPFK